MYNSLAEPAFDLIENLSKRNASLRQTRDLLLPKLISGQLDVEDLDIETGETLTMTE
jgi:type I restriction enzyme S subunit